MGVGVAWSSLNPLYRDASPVALGFEEKVTMRLHFPLYLGGLPSGKLCHMVKGAGAGVASHGGGGLDCVGCLLGSPESVSLAFSWTLIPQRSFFRVLLWEAKACLPGFWH